jgi:hypothetical protein
MFFSEKICKKVEAITFIRQQTPRVACAGSYRDEMGKCYDEKDDA